MAKSDRQCFGTGLDGRFGTTQWSVVLQAKDCNASDAQQALERLCAAYWPPLYAFLRRSGEDDASAKDITQGFFARLLEKDYLRQVEREKGKFRSFLLASLKHFLADERDKARAQKRGGGRVIPLDNSGFENPYALDHADQWDPEKLFERKWALALLSQARQRLRAEYEGRGKTSLYELLTQLESQDASNPTFADAAKGTGLSEGGLKAAMFRLRQRHRELVRDEVARTVGNPADVDDELRHLIAVLGM